MGCLTTGRRFDPTAAAPKKPQAEDDDLGGWGIELVRRQMDENLPPARGGQERPAFAETVCLYHHQIPSSGRTFRSSPSTLRITCHSEIQIQKNGANAGTVTLKLTAVSTRHRTVEKQLAPVLGGGVKTSSSIANFEIHQQRRAAGFPPRAKPEGTQQGQTSFIHMQPQIQEVFEISEVTARRGSQRWRNWIAIHAAARSHLENQ